MEKAELTIKGYAVVDSVEIAIWKTDSLKQLLNPKSVDDMVYAATLDGLILFSENYKEKVTSAIEKEDFGELNDLTEKWSSTKKVISEEIDNAILVVQSSKNN